MTPHRAYMSVGMKAANLAYKHRHKLKAGAGFVTGVVVQLWKNRRKK